MSQPIALPATRLSDTTLGLWLGLLGVVVFALTLPMYFLKAELV